MSIITNSTKFRKKEHINRNIAGVLFIIPIINEMPDMTSVCCVEGIGIEIWEEIDAEISFAKIIEKLILIYDVDESTLCKDAMEFIDILRDNKLVEVVTNGSLC